MSLAPPDGYPLSPYDWSPPWSQDGLNAAELVRDNMNFAYLTYYPAVVDAAVGAYYNLGGTLV